MNQELKKITILHGNAGISSVPLIIAIITAVIFVGIVVAAVNQERGRKSVNPEIERVLEHDGADSGSIENTGVSGKESGGVIENSVGEEENLGVFGADGASGAGE